MTSKKFKAITVTALAAMLSILAIACGDSNAGLTRARGDADHAATHSA
jgi:hypothetical protein